MKADKQHKLRRLDLNLLTALRILLEERNVTYAAKRLYVSQPAMSKTLQKLREEFQDPLFTRAAHGLVPTPRAKELAATLPAMLDQLTALVYPPEFDAVHYQGNFKIASSDILLNNLLPRLVRELQIQAPGMSIHATEVRDDYLELLASGELDFAVHINRPLDEDYLTTELGYSESICAMRADHPLANQAVISVDDFLTYPHVRLYMAQITQSNRGVVDELLIQAGKYRRIILETPNVNVALRVLAESDALMVIPNSVKALNGPEFATKALPKQVGFPVLETVLIQHRRTLASPPQQWLKQRITALHQEASTNNDSGHID